MKNARPLPSSKQRLTGFMSREFPEAEEEFPLTRLAGDASTREYFRYLAGPGKSFILTVYPETFDPLHFDYRQVHDLLRGIGLPVPELISLDGKLGIVLQQDLGDESLQKHLAGATESERRALLFKSIDYIVIIQQQGTNALTPGHQASSLAFDEDKLNWELDFFHRHYLGDYRNLKIDEEVSLREEFTRLSSELASSARFLCHRDYQVRNLMLKEEQIYIIDFQDARLGPVSYDLASLLKDSIQLEEDEISECCDYYLDQASRQSGHSVPKDFNRQFHLMCIQRLLKALGTYGNQISVRGKSVYRQYVQGSLQRALLSLQAIPEFPYIQSIVEQELDS